MATDRPVASSVNAPASRLFSRPCPPGPGADATVDEIFKRYDAVPPSAELERDAGSEWLLKTRPFALSPEDLDSIDHAFKAFYADGPEIHFWRSQPVHGLRPSYRQLMIAKDMFGRSRSFLATEEEFTFVRDLHSRNMIVPVVGDFGGPPAIRAVGD